MILTPRQDSLGEHYQRQEAEPVRARHHFPRDLDPMVLVQEDGLAGTKSCVAAA